MNIEEHFKNETNSKSHTIRAFLINDCHNMRWLVFLLICFICANCTHSTKTVAAEYTDDSIREIDIITNMSNTQKVNLSDIASGIEYCVLELDKKCLVTFDFSFYASDDYIVTINEAAHIGITPVCYVFERRTGKFVRQISSYGQGPGEYLNVLESFWDREKGQVCMLGANNTYKFYNIDGTLSHQVKRFENRLGFVTFEDFYVSYLMSNTKRIAFYDKTGALVDSIPNIKFLEKTQTWSYMNWDSWLFTFDNNLHFKDLYNDTLYQIKDFELHPRYLFNTDGLAVPYEKKEDGQQMTAEIMRRRLFETAIRYEKYMNIMKILESNRYLYFTVDYKKQLYLAIYDKIEDKSKIMSPVSYSTSPLYNKRVPLCGFENDLDGGLPFWPHQMISDKEMMCVYTPEELLALDISKITDPKLKNVLNSINEDSNPVIVIVTLKD